MKKILALLLATMLLTAVFAGCGKTANQAADSAPAADGSQVSSETPAADTAPADTDKAVTLTWMYTGNNVVDQSAVTEALDAYLMEKINAKLEMIWCGWGDFNDRVMMAINGGDPVDIYFTCSWSDNEYVATSKRGAYMRLDDPENNLLEKYAPDLFKSIPAVMADAALVDGANGFGVYAIPTVKEIAQQYYWASNGDILAKYGYTIDDVPDYYNLGEMMAKVKAGEGAGFYPINSDITVLERAVNNTDQMDQKGMIAFTFDPVSPSKSNPVITSAFETEAFKKFVEKQREYYLAGYVNPATSTRDTMSQAWTDVQTSGQYLVDAFPYYPGIELTWSAERGYPVVVKPISAGIISTTSARGAMNAISATSKNPDRAMMLLNLVNTDPYVRTTLTYGVEGVQFEKQSDGRIKFTDKKLDYNVWAAGLGKLSLLPATVDQPANIAELFDKFNSAESVPILGFSFDQEPVKTEYAVLSNVVDEFQYPLLSGSVDPAEKLPEFIAKLKANGLDKVVAEAEKQLADFMAKK